MKQETKFGVAPVEHTVKNNVEACNVLTNIFGNAYNFGKLSEPADVCYPSFTGLGKALKVYGLPTEAQFLAQMESAMATGKFIRADWQKYYATAVVNYNQWVAENP